MRLLLSCVVPKSPLIAETQGRIHRLLIVYAQHIPQYTASNLQQVANLLCAQANSASYPLRNGNT